MPASIRTLEEARGRIAELERKLDESFSLIVKRDDQLDAAARRIFDLENQLADLRRERA
jgi:hypothetical protein